MTNRRVLAGLLLATTFLRAPHVLAQEKQDVLAPIQIEGEAGTGSAGFDGYKAKEDASASKSDQPLEKTPQAVSVVGSRQIEDQAARSVVEATRYSPGIRSETFGNDTRNDWFLIRGFSSQVSSYFLDGLQLQSSDSFATWKVNPYLLDRIDVLRGPSSALYGASNPGGLINLVSKRPTFQNRGETAIGVNEFGNVWTGLDVEGVNKDGTLAYRFIATGNYGGTQVDFTDNDQFAIMPEVTWKPDEDTSLTVYANVSKLKTRGQNFLPYVGTVVDAPFGKIPRDLFTSEPSVDKFERSQQMIGYEFEHRFDNDVTVRQNLRYGHLEVDFRNVYGEGWVSPPTTTTALLDRANFLSKPDLGLFTVDNQVEWKTSTGSIDHTLLLGLDYKRFDLHDESGFEDAPPLDVLNPVYNGAPPVASRYDQSNTLQNQTGLYAQDLMTIDRLNLVFSGRYDDAQTTVTDRPTGVRASYSGDAFSGRAGAIYNFDNGISPYASISRSFLLLTGKDSSTGEAFKPETAVQYEVGVKYQPTWLSDVLLTASLFDLTRQNVVTSDGVLFNRQIGKVNSRGVELEAVGQLTPDLTLTAAYTWYDLKIKEGSPAEIGKVTTGTPEQFGSLWLDYAIPSDRLPGITIGGGVRYVGSSFADSANTQKVPDYAVVDAAIRYEKDNFKAALNVSNLFDKVYVASCNITCFYGESREISLTMGYKW
ncbi:TonB-dependent siderophore receptor [Mesorhizobium sp. WSM4906]|uniref:TonB-dependent siderophore receptor n=1 Tax=Mesorhizobium sp. WSM4906 TaxID=3038546 RepID=UPI0024161E87|nr:TonB-dependent siderophore receptor [Mesorhizobium sp. WSM4906]WFP75061.1 TonB-dependent siderophore receptor [Mesorhizobium sp. WSM4906]